MNQADYPVATMCRVLKVSKSGLYARRRRGLSHRARNDIRLTAQIEAIHRHSHGTYGAPRVHAELRHHGTHVGRKRVARLMRAAALSGVSRRRFITTTQRDVHAHAAEDLVQRHFQAAAPDRLWVADISVPQQSGVGDERCR